MENWKIIHNEFTLEKNANEESLFTIANGYIGFRGDMEETISEPFSKRGTYVNGFYERSTIPYGEVAYGYAKSTQTMLNTADTKQIKLTVDNEEFSLAKASISSYARTLNMQEGCVERTLVWNTAKSGRVEIVSKRFASMTRKNIAVITYEVKPLDKAVAVTLTTGINGSLQTGEESDDPRIAGGLGDGEYQVIDVDEICEKEVSLLHLTQATKKSKQHIDSFVKNTFFIHKDETFQAGKTWKNKKEIYETFEVLLNKNESCLLEKYICYAASSHCKDTKKEGLQALQSAYELGADRLFEEQKMYYRDFWQHADVSIKGDDVLTQSMRFNLFQLLQSVGKDSYSSIAAKGLSGEGYGGHYFWESEAYIMPVFLHTKPEIAKSLLEYRYHILDKAREQARLLGHKKGVLYAWRSIDGEECSAFFLGGSSQYHINADIAFGVVRYLQAKEDTDFLKKCAVEILLETARLWIDVGHYNNHKDGCFCIDGVTGPDEYTAMVNNNFYTNVMARENLWNAVKYAEKLKTGFPAEYEALCRKIDFEEEELKEFEKAANHMYIPYDEKLKIHKQDDTFLDKAVWNLEDIPKEDHPLLTHYHPLYIYRHQICKQADLILAEYYLPQYFSKEDRIRDYNYYEKVTTHDSSLSASVFSIMAADNGDIEKAYQYFIQTVRTDLDDNQKNTKDGLHMANMAGAWLCIVTGFAGMRVTEGTLTFSPVLPEEWNGYEFTVSYRDAKIHVTVLQNQVEYELESETGEMQIEHKHKVVKLQRGKNVVAN